MADDTLTETQQPRVPAFFDAALSRFLQYDLSRTDMVKWVAFARRTFILIIGLVVIVAGLSASLSIRQARALLEGALSSEANALAESISRAAFVPLVLEDEPSLDSLIDSVKPVEHLGLIEIRDARGKVRRRYGLGTDRQILAQAPVVPAERAAGSSGPVGEVVVGMGTAWLDKRMAKITATTIASIGAIALLVSALGLLIIGRLVEQTRHLVGEARLVEEVRRANAELEAFSYSVAHDLRAPLRHIGGFIDLLKKSLGDGLDPEAAHFVSVIDEAAKKLGRMIDDLLNFSRMSRAEMNTTKVDLGELVRQQVKDLQEQNQDRQIKWKVSNLPIAEGDPALLQLALENLIRNAIKFTRDKTPAVIEIGSRKEPGRIVAFVKDNGAGFDMEYADKLFGVFQRLHRQDEFEGTGIGLANVKRIIAKHGGDVWAEGAVGAGATFFFSLPDRPRLSGAK